MLASIRYCLTHLTDFSGRDARQTFWFYVLFLFIVQFVIGFIVAIPMYVAMFGGMISAMQSGADQDEATISMMTGMLDQMYTQTLISAIIGIVVIGLFAASFVRRLHDAGFPAWIVFIPIATQVFGLVYSVLVFDDVRAFMEAALDAGTQPNAMAIQAEVAPYSMLSWIGYLVVIGFGVLKSQDGPNRYGEEPVRF